MKITFTSKKIKSDGDNLDFFIDEGSVYDEFEIISKIPNDPKIRNVTDP